MSLQTLAVLCTIAVFALPLVAVGLCFSAKRLGDSRAGFYLALTATAWAGFAGLALIVAGR